MKLSDDSPSLNHANYVTEFLAFLGRTKFVHRSCSLGIEKYFRRRFLHAETCQQLTSPLKSFEKVKRETISVIIPYKDPLKLRFKLRQREQHLLPIYFRFIRFLLKK